LEDSRRDFFCFHVTLCVLAVGETVLLEEPARAALAFFIPFGSRVVMFSCESSCPSFICEHADFAVGEEILDHCGFLVISPSFLPVAASFVFVETSAFFSTSWTCFGFIRVLHLESWRERHVKGAEDNLAYERAKIDNQVVNFVAVLS
jgi:hypothetical protein